MVVITSADSRIRVLDGLELVHRFKGKKLLSTIFHFEFTIYTGSELQNKVQSLLTVNTEDQLYLPCSSFQEQCRNMSARAFLLSLALLFT